MERVRWPLARPLSRETVTGLAGLVGVLFAVAGVGGLLSVAFARDAILHPTALGVISVVAMAVGALLLVVGQRDAEIIHTHFGPFVYGLLLLGSLLVTAAQVLTGPRFVVAVIVYVEIAIFAFYLLPRARALACVAVVGVEFALVLVLQDGYTAAAAQWMYLVATLLVVGLIFGGLLNRGVEESVQLGRLRRFLPPQVADAVLSTGSEALLAPHRRQIAVLFCDLRGFTAFAAGAEPEEVVDILDQYYAAVGDVLRAAEATVGTFAGDGVMAYFNDPVPCPDPAGAAVHVGLALRPPLDDLAEAWGRKGFDLGYGIGIAYGYATLGVIGFEGRHDYTALGSVVNLAARLCGEARNGEVLIDQRTCDALADRVATDTVELQLKGFAAPVVAHRVAAGASALQQLRPASGTG